MSVSQSVYPIFVVEISLYLIFPKINESFEGLFLGLLHLTMTLTSLAISSLYTTRGLDERASNIFAVTNIVQV